MLAVFKTGGKQYSVKTGQVLEVEKLIGNKGDKILFKDVLAVIDTKQKTIGTPNIVGAVVEAKIIDQTRGTKIVVFKKRRRQNYRSTKGHRQYLTVLKIESIAIGKNKSNSITQQKEESKKIISKVKSEKKPIKKTLTKKKSVKKKTVKKVTKKTTKKENK
tara:strand:- start:87 stop:569 length:483 start_codon:yes stop_codon:yes gene_type:complete